MKRLTDFRKVVFFTMLCSLAASANTVREPKEWAFLIFLNGHNNLAQYSDLNINQLESIGSTKDVDVVVQWAKTGFDKTYRLKVEKDNDLTKVTSPFVETLPRQDMGDYHNLVEFVRWAHEKYPAKHYFVSFWNHGSGWHRDDGKYRGISYDDYSGHHITTAEMGIAMRQIASTVGHKVDVVGADACEMAMAEVGSEMADSVDYFVASEEVIPGLGWPYDKFYERWAQNPQANGAVVTSILVDEYYKYLSPKENITLSSMNLGEFPKFWSDLRNLSATLTRLPDERLMAIKKATQSAVSFSSNDYVDLGDWLNKAIAEEAKYSHTEALKETSETMRKLVVANKTSKSFAAAEGVAFWNPKSPSVYESYKQLFSELRHDKETHWSEFIERMQHLPVCVKNQNGQWANEVVGFSSQYAETGQWSAAQVLGACDTSTYGDYGTSWTPKATESTEEWITVKFANPVHATGAVIRETNGNGFITQIEAIDLDGNSHLVWKGEDTSAIGNIVDFETSWQATSYLVKGLKIGLTTTKNPKQYKEIDSIQLIGTP